VIGCRRTYDIFERHAGGGGRCFTFAYSEDVDELNSMSDTTLRFCDGDALRAMRARLRCEWEGEPPLPSGTFTRAQIVKRYVLLNGHEPHPTVVSRRITRAITDGHIRAVPRENEVGTRYVHVMTE
jgi:hypothetical protein